jgi:tripartite-type tricarboxylate transporter receptor subunit TctC
MTFVPYSATPPAINALLGNHVTAALVGYAEAIEHLKAGTVRALVTGARSRVQALPDVPTIAEAGYRDAEIDLWFGTVVPARTPRQTVAELAGWFTTAMDVAQVKSRLADLAFQPNGVCGANFGAFLRKQYEDYGRTIREADIKAE